MRPLEYPQNIESGIFSPQTGDVQYPKKSQSQPDIAEQFFDINPDSYTEKARKDTEVESAKAVVGGLTQVASNVAPLQDDNFSLGLPTKAWKKVYSYEYADQNGAPIGYYKTVNAGGTNVVASANNATLNLVSTDNTVSIAGNNPAQQVNLRLNKSAVQVKQAVTIGYGAENDYVCSISNPLDAFQTLVNDLAGSAVRRHVYVQSGSYLLNGTLVIPNNFNCVWEGAQGSCDIGSTVTVAVQFGGATPPSGNFYQMYKGISFETIQMRATCQLSFNDCTISKLLCGSTLNATGFDTYRVRFNNCVLNGIDIVRAYDISFVGGEVNTNGSNFGTVNQSSNILFTGVSINNLGTINGTNVIILSDSASIATSRIAFEGCSFDCFGGGMNLLSDLRTNAASNRIKFSGMINGVAFNPAAYLNPPTNKFDFV